MGFVFIFLLYGSKDELQAKVDKEIFRYIWDIRFITFSFNLF